jgi:Gas vesicle synthesis protein GvpL/GvpF
VIELYAIARHPGPPLPELAPLRAVPFDGLVVVCGPAAEGEEVTEEALWRHEEIVEALMNDRDVLPVRYGTRVADENEAARAVAGLSDRLRAALEHVSGAAELSLRVRAQEPGTEPDLSSLRPLARDAIVKPGRDDGDLLRCSYLVERGRVAAFRDAVAELQRSRPELGFLLTGPWPPYSFSGP